MSTQSSVPWSIHLWFSPNYTCCFVGGIFFAQRYVRRRLATPLRHVPTMRRPFFTLFASHVSCRRPVATIIACHHGHVTVAGGRIQPPAETPEPVRERAQAAPVFGPLITTWLVVVRSPTTKCLSPAINIFRFTVFNNNAHAHAIRHAY